VEENYIKKNLRRSDGAFRPELVLHPGYIDDLMLWKAFRSGDEKALMMIFERYTQPLYNYGVKIIAANDLVNDSVQELFIEIWQNRARLGDTDSIKFYLFKSLRRKLIRAKRRTENRLFGTFSVNENAESSPSHEFILVSEQLSIERKEQVMNLLGTLTRRQHEAIFLRYFEELNCDQIAAVMDLSKQAVYNLIHQALERMKKVAAR
jgi:RNA polymerase sigma factor (sigma-70 family)